MSGLHAHPHVRFYRHFEKRGPNECWEWTGAKDTRGYGQLRREGRNVFATHISLEIDGRDRPDKSSCALHKCDNPPCVNPNHLWWGSRKDNARDAMSKGRMDLSGLDAHRQKVSAHAIKNNTVKCENCGGVFLSTPSRVANNKRHFCKKECCSVWQSKAFTGTAKASW
jgi:hypothetical protein